MPTSRRVCLFGTSANPPTGRGGHAGIVEHLSSFTWKSGNEIKKFDEVRVLPVYKHMFHKKRNNQASYEDRLAMCELAFLHIPNVVVSDEERKCVEYVSYKRGITASEEKLNLKVGTADLLEMFMEENDSIEYSLALGHDTFMDLTEWKWRRSKEVIKMLQGRLIVFRRLTTEVSSQRMNHNENNAKPKTQDVSSGDIDDGEELITSEDKSLEERIQRISSDLSQCCPKMRDNVQIMDVELSAVSSSDVRASQDEKKLSSILDPKILQYIKDRKMYAFNRM